MLDHDLAASFLWDVARSPMHRNLQHVALLFISFYPVAGCRIAVPVKVSSAKLSSLSKTKTA